MSVWNELIADPTRKLFLEKQTSLLLSSYKHWMGKDLLLSDPDPLKTAYHLFHEDFVILSHGTEKDPILNYANQKTLDLWEMDWALLTQTPSRHTAETPNQKERQRFLDEVSQKGFCENYSGVRISRTGKRFQIKKALVWNLTDAAGAYQGQAAFFEKWINDPPSS